MSRLTLYQCDTCGAVAKPDHAVDYYAGSEPVGWAKMLLLPVVGGLWGPDPSTVTHACPKCAASARLVEAIEKLLAKDEAKP